MKKLYIIFLAFFIATVTSCTYSFPEPEVSTAGSADFTKVVAVGNSLTAGYMNGALYDAGQAAAFANIVAQQINANGGGVFNQPDIAAPDGSYGGSGGAYGRLHLVNPLSPAPSPIIPGQPITAYGGDKAALNNFGVPGMRIVHAEVPGYGDPNAGNPYFARFASSGTTSVLADVSAANGTFFTFWLGNNDVLGYALAGATGSTDGANGADMTPISVFSDAYNSTITTMQANGAKGIIANIPNVQDIAHFTTVTWDAIPMDQASADAANAGYVVFNGGVNAYNAGMLPGQDPLNPPTTKRDTIGFISGNNGIVMYDSTMANLNAYGIPTIRQAKSSDLITLTAGAVLGEDPDNPAIIIGVSVPLAEKYTLIQADQEAIADRVASFNGIIKTVVDGSGGTLALLDINAIFADVAQNGASINGAGLDASMLPVLGAFSLDGVHPNERGSAYIASLFIDKINEVFGSNIPNINPNDYPGNSMPVPN